MCFLGEVPWSKPDFCIFQCDSYLILLYAGFCHLLNVTCVLFYGLSVAPMIRNQGYQAVNVAHTHTLA